MRRHHSCIARIFLAPSGNFLIPISGYYCMQNVRWLEYQIGALALRITSQQRKLCVHIIWWWWFSWVASIIIIIGRHGHRPATRLLNPLFSKLSPSLAHWNYMHPKEIASIDALCVVNRLRPLLWAYSLARYSAYGNTISFISLIVRERKLVRLFSLQSVARAHDERKYTIHFSLKWMKMRGDNKRWVSRVGG